MFSNIVSMGFEVKGLTFKTAKARGGANGSLKIEAPVVRPALERMGFELPPMEDQEKAEFSVALNGESWTPGPLLLTASGDNGRVIAENMRCTVHQAKVRAKVGKPMALVLDLRFWVGSELSLLRLCSEGVLHCDLFPEQEDLFEKPTETTRVMAMIDAAAALPAKKREKMAERLVEGAAKTDDERSQKVLVLAAEYIRHGGTLPLGEKDVGDCTAWIRPALGEPSDPQATLPLGDKEE